MPSKQSTFAERKSSHSSAPKGGKTGSFFDRRTKNSAGSFFTPVSSPAVQPKLTIGQPGDKYEQEADAMAEQVVQAESIQRQSVPEEEEMLQGKRLQRQSNPEEEELLQSKPLGEAAIQRQCAACEQEGQLQRQAAPEEEEMLQSKPLLMRAAENGAATATPQLASQLKSSKGGGRPLPKDTLSSMNNVFATDFSGVHVHTGSRAQAMSQGIQAKAFTHGSDIYFNRGQYNPGSTEGKRLLGHELTHVVQQNAIKPLLQTSNKGTPQYLNFLKKSSAIKYKSPELLRKKSKDQKVNITPDFTNTVRRMGRAPSIPKCKDDSAPSNCLEGKRQDFPGGAGMGHTCIKGKAESFPDGTVVDLRTSIGTDLASCGRVPFPNVTTFKKAKVKSGKYCVVVSNFSSSTPGVGKVFQAVIDPGGTNQKLCCTRMSSGKCEVKK